MMINKRIHSGTFITGSRKRAAAAVLAIVLGTAALAGCGSISQNTDSTAQAAAQTEENAVNASSGTASVASGTAKAASGTGSAAVTKVSVSDMFSERDLSGEVESGAAKITFDGSSISANAPGVTVSGTTVTISKEGTYIFSGTLSDGQIVVEAGTEDKVQIVLSGVTLTNDDSACILVNSADKVFITLADGTVNTLSDTGAAYTLTDDRDVDGVIFSSEDLTLNGSGTLVVNAGYAHAVVSKDDLKIAGGTYEITAEKKAFSGKDSIRIAGGTFTVKCGNDAFHTSNDEDEDKGFIYVADGIFTIDSGDDAFHAEKNLTIDGGTVTIENSHEGIEAATIDINGGAIVIYADDDGVNATGDGSGRNSGQGMAQNGGFGGFGMMDSDSSAYLRIAGGELYVNAGGDGIDSNGTILMEGGTLVIDGPTNSGNGSMDAALGATVTGGTVMSAGASGMAESFGNASTQYSILCNLSTVQQGGTEVVLKDADGQVVLQYTPAKQYQSVLISSADLKEGTYTLICGTETVTVEVTGVTTVSGNGAMGGMRGGKGGMQGGKDGMFGGEGAPQDGSAGTNGMQGHGHGGRGMPPQDGSFPGQDGSVTPPQDGSFPGQDGSAAPPQDGTFSGQEGSEAPQQESDAPAKDI